MEAYTAIMMTVGAVIVIFVLFLMVLLRAMARDRETAIAEGEAARPPGRAAVYEPEELRRSPLGTLALLMFYLMVLIGLWGSIYVLLIQRA